MSEPTAYTLLRTDRFVSRHIGPRRDDIQAMVHELGYDTLEAFTDAVVPADIRLPRPLDLPPSRSEREVLQALRGLAPRIGSFAPTSAWGTTGPSRPR
jgi:glycine dehydrogenase